MRGIQLFLSFSDFGADPIFSIVDVAAIEKLHVEILDFQLKELSLIVGALDRIASRLKLHPPIFFIPPFTVGWRLRRKRSSGGKRGGCGRTGRCGAAGCCRRRRTGNDNRASKRLPALAL